MNELQHYGVPGMKWGVRKSITIGRAKRDAKRLSKANAKSQETAKRLSGQMNLALYTNTLGDRRVARQIDRTTSTLARQEKRGKQLLDKMKKRYENTTLSDITVKTHYVPNGKAYCQVLMGQVGDSPYDGSSRYQVTAGTWTRSVNGDLND